MILIMLRRIFLHLRFMIWFVVQGKMIKNIL